MIGSTFKLLVRTLIISRGANFTSSLGAINFNASGSGIHKMGSTTRNQFPVHASWTLENIFQPQSSSQSLARTKVLLLWIPHSPQQQSSVVRGREQRVC